MKGILLIKLLLLFQLSYAASLDSTLNSLQNLSDSSKVDSIIKLSRSFVIQGEGINALPFARYAYTTAKKNGLKDLIPKAHFYLGASFSEAKMYDSALYHYEASLSEMPGTAHEDWAKHVYINIPWICQNMGDYGRALEYQIKALEWAERKKDSMMMAEYTTEIGYSHDRMRAFDEAIKWHRKALEILTAMNQKGGFYHYILSRIGMAYDDLAQFDSAFHYNFKALNYFEQIQDSAEVAGISSNIGNSYLKLKEWDKALAYTLKAYRLKLGSSWPSSLSITQTNLGLIYTGLKQYKEAAFYFQEAIKSSNTLEHKKSLSEAYDGLYKMYQQQGKFDSAFYYFKKMDEIEDSIYQLKRTEQMAEMQTRFETEKKEQQIALQQAEIVQKESELLARQRLILLLALLLVAITTLSYLFYQSYKAKKEAELQNAVIEEQQKGLKAVLDAQEEERKRISKDLHDGVGQQLSGIKMAFQKMAKHLGKEVPEQQSELQKLSKVLEESADEVRSISHQMMPKALTELGLVEALEDLFAKSLGALEMEYEFEHYGINGRLEERLEVSLYRISQELVNNILKHAKAKRVAIQLFKNKGKLILIIEDDGIGIKSQEAKDGHGLLNIKSRLNPLSGEVNFEPSPQSGTIATIRIPLLD